MARLRTAIVWAFAVLFVGAGINHFLRPAPYIAMMPPYLPWHAALVAVSGVAEVVGGLALPVVRLRRFAGWGLIALLVAVFPANVQVALHGWPGVNLPGWALWARLPFQPVLIAAVYWSCRLGGSGGELRRREAAP